MPFRSSSWRTSMSRRCPRSLSRCKRARRDLCHYPRRRRTLGAVSLPECCGFRLIFRCGNHSQPLPISGARFQQRCCGQAPVLVDGRSVYTPFASGVYWICRCAAQDVIGSSDQRPRCDVMGANASWRDQHHLRAVQRDRGRHAGTRRRQHRRQRPVCNMAARSPMR